MKISSNLTEYEKDLMELARVFYPKFSNTEEDVTIFHIFKKLKNEEIENSFTVTDKLGTYSHTRIDNAESQNTVSLRKLLQIGLYETLSVHTKTTMPWGSLIGIRPVKVVQDLLKAGFNRLSAINHLKNTYYVSEEKCNLISEIIDIQGHRMENEKLINFYIHIPFCVSRCSYCSFMSAQVDKVKPLIEPYVDALVEEIRHAKKLIAEKNYIVKTIYIGGGTPTSFDEKSLERILAEVAPYHVNEFTVEAGRADTITKEKLDVFKKYGVTRISINPQTFQDSVLKKANRQHTVQQFLDAYKMALPYEFIINMDLIAGLEGETIKSFKTGIDTLLELSPQNVTVHTLTLKRASTLNKNEVNIFKKSKAQKMLDYAYKKLRENDYYPYYMYRQKNMLENLENIGFCKKNTACTFNIDSIDEYASIIACGAGGVSKRIYLSDNRKEQAFNVKDIKEYIERMPEMKMRKEILFS